MALIDTVSLEDIRALAHLHELIEELIKVAQEGLKTEILKDSSKGIERVILGDVEDVERALGVVMERLRNALGQNESGLIKESATQNSFTIDSNILSEFVSEATEHLESADISLLELEKDSTNSEAINRIFRAFHTIKGTAGFLGLNEILALSHETETLLDRARKATVEINRDFLDSVFDAARSLKELVEQVRMSPNSGEKRATNKKNALPNLGAKISENQDRAVVSGPTRARAEMIQRVEESIKVEASRLDTLIDLIGELVITESMVCQSDEVTGINSPELQKRVVQLRKITRGLHELTVSLRMVPIKSLFRKMPLIVRDLTRKSGKKVELILTGEETEADRNLIEKISDPIMHIIRNAIDHGIEFPDERKKAGKEETGRIEMSAYCRNGHIFIEIRDDGRGIDREAVLRKGIEKGLIADNPNISDREIYSLIFHPGFSTAKEVTEVSGRGVGMDVVRKNIELLRGSCDVESKWGQGSKFTLKLPLTLAIIDGMLVESEFERYIIPTSSVINALTVSESEISSIRSVGNLMKFHGEYIPVYSLRTLLDINNESVGRHENIIVVVENDGVRGGLLCDRLIGQQQIVIKSLGAGMEEIPSFSGGAIMSDGKVALILDVQGLMEVAKSGNSSTLSDSIMRGENNESDVLN